jgi:hypothetical protein
MNKIKELRKPPTSLVRLIECIGVLLFIPITKKKSNYKITLPSNYDDTIEALINSYDECIVKISQLDSSQIENETAAIFYNKILEPSFIYEDAINAGGLIARDFFNNVLLVLQRLQADRTRIPTLIQNALVLVDGSRASMVALDTAAHISKHGTLHILADNMLLTSATSPKNMAENIHLLKIDIHRRCKSHYKIPDHCFQIHGRMNYEEGGVTNGGYTADSISSPYGALSPTTPGGGNKPLTPGPFPSDTILFPTGNDLYQQLLTTKQNLQDLSDMYECSTLILGLQNPYDFDLTSKDSLPYWSVWDYPGDTIITKGISYSRPFTEVFTPRTFLIYLNPDYYRNNLSQTPKRENDGKEGNEPISYFNEEKIIDYFIQCLRHYRPGDNMIILSIFPTIDPLGDNDYETRYEFGSRHLWLKNTSSLSYESNKYNWNEEIIQNYSNFINNLIAKSFLNGRLIIERLPPKNYPGNLNFIQLINQIALQESVQGIILSKRIPQNEEIIRQCIRDNPFSLFLLK